MASARHWAGLGIVCVALSGCLTIERASIEEDLPEPQFAEFRLSRETIGPGSGSIVAHFVAIRPFEASFEYAKMPSARDGCGALSYGANVSPQGSLFFPLREAFAWIDSSGLRPAVSTGQEQLDPGLHANMMAASSSKESSSSALLKPGDRFTLQLSLDDEVQEDDVWVRVSNGDNISEPVFAIERLERITFSCGGMHDFDGTYATAGNGLPTWARQAYRRGETQNATTAWIVARVAPPFRVDVGGCQVSIESTAPGERSEGTDWGACNVAFRGGPGTTMFHVESVAGRAPYVVYYLWDGAVELDCPLLKFFSFDTVPCMPGT